jgi:hypothetical protein
MVRREFCTVSDPQKNQRRTVVGSSSAPVLLVVRLPPRRAGVDVLRT